MVEGLWVLKDRQPEIEIQFDCSPAVQSRASVKWGSQDLHCEASKGAKEPAPPPTLRKSLLKDMCSTGCSAVPEKYFLSLQEPYTHICPVFVAFDRTASCHLSFPTHLSIFLTALNHLEGRACSNLLLPCRDLAGEMLTRWVRQQGRDPVGKTPGRV